MAKNHDKNIFFHKNIKFYISNFLENNYRVFSIFISGKLQLGKNFLDQFYCDRILSPLSNVAHRIKLHVLKLEKNFILPEFVSLIFMLFDGKSKQSSRCHACMKFFRGFEKAEKFMF